MSQLENGADPDGDKDGKAGKCRGCGGACSAGNVCHACTMKRAGHGAGDTGRKAPPQAPPFGG